MAQLAHRSLSAVPFVATVLVFLTPPALAVVNIETVLVGNAGNTADTRVMNDGSSGYGDVAYDYRIGKFEVTNDQYVEFLRAVASVHDPYELHSLFMGTSVYGGITRNGVDGSYTFAVKPNMGNKPVAHVTFWDAARFANWMHNLQPTGEQTAATTETGAYTLNGIITFGGAAIARSPGARWFIPSDDEWFKAAFYDPRTAAAGGPPGNDHYWLYATASDIAPVKATANAVGDINNSGANVANYGHTSDWNGTPGTGNVTSVGTAGAASASYYGTHDQSGNLGEFNENNAATGQAYRTLRGGNYNPETAYWVSGAERTWTTTNSEGSTVGFRLASILNPPVPNPANSGDYNHNGTVDAADYVLWRKTFGQSASGLPADGDGDGSIGIGDYNHWRAKFGNIVNTAASLGESSAVPEPATPLLALVAVAIACRRPRRLSHFTALRNQA